MVFYKKWITSTDSICDWHPKSGSGAMWVMVSGTPFLFLSGTQQSTPIVALSE
jgi:hypothetical protein